MNFAKRIYYSFIFILIFSTVITIAGINGFQRLAPFVNTLNSSNTESLYYAEQMLSSISVKKDLKTFESNLNKAKNNITEKGEKEAVDKIADNYLPAFKGNKKVEEETINEITALSKINRLAMEQAGLRAKKTQTVGIWIIIFPSIFIWIIGFTLMARLKRTFIKPMQELNDVIFDYNNGNRMRRCPSYTVSKDLQKLYDGINRILDEK
ncbi:hypothetical protein IJ674_06265 [bacterium]|nr:hypothetical protein [bacterium]